MSRRLHALLLLVLSLVPFAASAADGVLIPAPNAVDMVHDAKRGLVYISTSDGKILRYKISTASFLSPFAPSPTANLAGMDLVSAGTHLAVADRDSSATEVWVLDIDPDSGKATRLTAQKVQYESGLLAVAYAYNGFLYTSSYGGNWLPLRKFFPRARHGQTIDTVRNGTVLAASADRKTIAFAEADSSDGPWGIVDVPTGQIVRRQGYEDGTSSFNFEIAADRLGATIAIPTGRGAYIYDVDYQHVATVGDESSQPVGVAFHPAQARAYFPVSNSSEIRVYDTSDWHQVGAYDAGMTFQYPLYTSFQPGHTRISANGRYLMVRVANGVRLIDLSAGMAVPKPAPRVRSR